MSVYSCFNCVDTIVEDQSPPSWPSVSRKDKKSLKVCLKIIIEPLMRERGKSDKY